jgi:hypothetical protein
MTVPGIVYIFNNYMGALTQKDMYPTDEIYEAIFNFSEKDSPIEHFEILGYEGASFITMTGSAFINVLTPIVAAMIYSFLRWLTFRYWRIKFMR